MKSTASHLPNLIVTCVLAVLFAGAAIGCRNGETGPSSDTGVSSDEAAESRVEEAIQPDDPEAVQQGSDKHADRFSDFGPITILPLRGPMTLKIGP